MQPYNSHPTKTLPWRKENDFILQKVLQLGSQNIFAHECPLSKILEYHMEGVRWDSLNFFCNSLTEYILIWYGCFKNFIFQVSPQEIIQGGQKTFGNEPVTEEPVQHCHRLLRYVWLRRLVGICNPFHPLRVTQ